MEFHFYSSYSSSHSQTNNASMSNKITRRKELEFPYQEAESYEVPKVNISKSLDDIPNPKYHQPNKEKNYGSKDNFDRNENNFSEKKYSKSPYKNSSRSEGKFSSEDRNKQPNKFGKKPFSKNDGENTFDNKFGKKPFSKNDGDRPSNNKFGKKPFSKNDGDKSFDNKFGKKTFSKNDRGFDKFEKPKYPNSLKDKIDEVKDDNRVYRSAPLGKNDKNISYKSQEGQKKSFKEKDAQFEVMPLNKFLAKCGVCSRREAVEIIKNKRVKVDKITIDTPGYKIEQGMVVYLDDKRINIQEKKIYILLNKPKGYITTLDDPKGRRIISDLYSNHFRERIYPVGRLDRNTSGIILITNDGELSQQLTHPKYDIKKIYQVELDRKLSEQDFSKIAEGLELEDGPIKVDDISYLEDKKTIGVEIHSGRNRIVRRIFEHLGYTVEKLDRVYFAGLTKKNLMRGKWRFLTDQEVINLKHLGKKKA